MPVEPTLLDAVTRLVSLLDSPQDVAPLAPLVLCEITYRLLAGPQGLRLRQIAAAGAPAQRIARATAANGRLFYSPNVNNMLYCFEPAEK
jgi:hypothetical protein